MNKSIMSNILGIAGVLFIINAGFVLQPWVGLLLLGLALLFAGYLLDGGDKE